MYLGQITALERAVFGLGMGKTLIQQEQGSMCICEAKKIFWPEIDVEVFSGLLKPHDFHYVDGFNRKITLDIHLCPAPGCKETLDYGMVLCILYQ